MAASGEGGTLESIQVEGEREAVLEDAWKETRGLLSPLYSSRRGRVSQQDAPSGPAAGRVRRAGSGAGADGRESDGGRP